MRIGCTFLSCWANQKKSSSCLTVYDEPAGNPIAGTARASRQWQTSTTVPQATSQVVLGALQSLLANLVQSAMVPMSSVIHLLDNSLKGIQTSFQRLQTAATEHTPNKMSGYQPVIQASSPPSTLTQNMGIGTPAMPIGQTPSTVVQTPLTLGEPQHGLNSSSLSNCVSSCSAATCMPNPSSLPGILLHIVTTCGDTGPTLGRGTSWAFHHSPITCTLGTGVNISHSVTVGPNVMSVHNKLIQKIKQGEYVDITRVDGGEAILRQ